MNRKDNYIRPEVEVVEFEIEGVIASTVTVGGTTSDPGNARERRSFWMDEN